MSVAELLPAPAAEPSTVMVTVTVSACCADAASADTAPESSALKLLPSSPVTLPSSPDTEDLDETSSPFSSTTRFVALVSVRTSPSAVLLAMTGTSAASGSDGASPPVCAKATEPSSAKALPLMAYPEALERSAAVSPEAGAPSQAKRTTMRTAPLASSEIHVTCLKPTPCPFAHVASAAARRAVASTIAAAPSVVACSIQMPPSEMTATTRSDATETSAPSKERVAAAAQTSSAVTVIVVVVAAASEAVVICGAPSSVSATVWNAELPRNASGSLPCVYCQADQPQNATATAATAPTMGRQMGALAVAGSLTCGSLKSAITARPPSCASWPQRRQARPHRRPCR